MRNKSKKKSEYLLVGNTDLLKQEIQNTIQQNQFHHLWLKLWITMTALWSLVSLGPGR